EFNFRLRRAGYVVWLSPAIRAKYHTRPTFMRMARQFAQYGLWKVYVNRKHRAVTTWRQLVPPVWVTAFAATGLAALVGPAGRLGLGLLVATYLIAAAAAALHKTRDPKDALLLVWCFCLLHASYGAGYLRGLWRLVVLRCQPAELDGTLTR